MRRIGILDLVKLNKVFDEYGKHDRVVDYLALPRISLGDRTSEFIKDFKQCLINRTPFDNLPNLGFASKDYSILKKRVDLLQTNNEAYVLAIKTKPTVTELMRLSFIDPCWSILFPIKLYLIHHSNEAKEYRGLLPFGSQVVLFYNETGMGPEIKGTPSFSDHVRLMEVSNVIADQLGCSTVSVNNEMYLEGGRIKE